MIFYESRCYVIFEMRNADIIYYYWVWETSVLITLTHKSRNSILKNSRNWLKPMSSRSESDPILINLNRSSTLQSLPLRSKNLLPSAPKRTKLRNTMRRWNKMLTNPILEDSVSCRRAKMQKLLQYNLVEKQYSDITENIKTHIAE